MKRIGAIFLIFLCCTLLALPVFAESSASSVESAATITSQGNCQMTLKFHLSLEESTSQLVFPLGDNVKQLTVNGAKTRLRKIDGVPSAVLSSDGGFSGEMDFLFTYTITGCVSPKTDWQLRLPILSGLAYPISDLQFTITMPGTFTQTPLFTSGYYGADIDNYMTVSITDGVITGKVTTTLKDHETLSMTLDTDPAMFPRNHTAGVTLTIDKIGILACLAGAVLYWILFLRWLPPRIIAQPQPPAGYTAGELSSRLTGRKTELSLIILTWAQLGYLTIHISHDRAVTLHKLMDMGNERSAFEQKTFQALFGKGQVVAATSGRFGSLNRQVAESTAGLSGQFTPKSGNPIWMRFICLLAGLFAGVAIGDCLAAPGASRYILLALLGLAGLGCCYLLQKSIYSFIKPFRFLLPLSAAATAFLLGLGVFSGCLLYSLGAILAQFLAGVGTMFGGQRSAAGKQTVQQALGLRRYCKTVDRKQLHRITRQNPDYYYDVAPYALALGVDRQFASRFETMHLPPCGWLVSDFPQKTVPAQWYPLLREVVRTMQGRQPSRLPSDPHSSKKDSPSRIYAGSRR